MRALGTLFSLLVVIIFLSATGLVVQQNPQAAQWLLFGQAFSVPAGVVVGSAALVGFLLAVFFAMPFVGAPKDASTKTWETAQKTWESAQITRDLLDSREQYRKLQAEQSQLQAAYNQLAAERDRLRAQQSGQAISTAALPMPLAQSNGTGPERPHVLVWGIPLQPASDTVTGLTAPSEGGNPNTWIVMPPPSPGGGPTQLAPTDTHVAPPPSPQIIKDDDILAQRNGDEPPPPSHAGEPPALTSQ
jgi:uncharacterized integral membrane protein